MTALTTIIAACGSDDHRGAPTGAETARPTVRNFSVAENSTNVLSAIATVTLAGADSARVVYWTRNGSEAATPFTTDVTGGRIVVLGLRPFTSYNFAVEAVGDRTVRSDTVIYTTGVLPLFLTTVSLRGNASSSGGYILAALLDGSIGYAVAFDSVGRVAWYRAFPGGKPALEIKQQRNGDITVVLTTSHGGEQVEGEAVALTPDGTIVRTFDAPAGSFFDGHELWELFTADGAYDGAVFLAYTARHLDLSAHGGPADSVLSGHQIVRQDASGNQHVVFDAWDHFALTDNVEPSGPDFDHPNSLDITADGNYVVSWRNLDLITKIDASTGALLWTLASPFSPRASVFAIVGDPLNGFSAQHDARVLDSGNLLLFDNGTSHPMQASRAVEYQLDTAAHTATMVWQFAHAPAYYTAVTGSVQRLANGNTLIGWTFGNPEAATEVTTSGTTAWEAPLRAPGQQVPYRFTKIVSLYQYVRP
jgi:hypothetical protein